MGMRADELPRDIATDVIWNLVAPDFKAVPLFSEFEGDSAVHALLGARASGDDMLKARRRCWRGCCWCRRRWRRRGCRPA